MPHFAKFKRITYKQRIIHSLVVTTVSRLVIIKQMVHKI